MVPTSYIIKEKIPYDNMEETITFSLVTYNLDSQEFNFEERLYSFIALIKKESPDIVLIQEGRKYTYEILGREMSQLGYKYKLLDMHKKRKTGELIFSRHTINEYRFIPFNHNAEYEYKGMTIVSLDIMGETIVVATTQLHHTTPLQTKQLKSIPQIFKKYTSENLPIVLGGDFQLSSYQTIDIPKGWEDAWDEEGTDLDKFTIDNENNILVSPPIKDRADRIWYTSRLECQEFKLIGIDHKPSISTHYGIKVEFELV